MIKEINSHKNPFIKRLKGMDLKKNRDKEGAFVVEGLRFVEEIPISREIEAYAVSESFAAKNSLKKYEERAALFLLPDALFDSLCNTEHPQGILAVCKKETADFWEVSENGFYILSEELNDPGNLGTLIRTAAACGVDGIFLSNGSVDVYHPKVLRATMGAIFHVPIYQNVSLKNVAVQLKEKGVSLYAAHLEGTCYPFDLPLKEGCAFFIGNEARGLTEEVSSYCHKLVKIPMPGYAESLNVSVAAAMLMYEVVRQRA